MTGKAFLDTNILVYASDRDSPWKRERAQALVADLSGRAVVSTQVLQEYFVATTRKLNVEPLRAKDAIRATRSSAEIITVTPDLIDRAIDLAVLLPVSFWDGLILSAAESAACTVVYSEDLNPGQRYAGVTVLNPFLEAS